MDQRLNCKELLQSFLNFDPVPEWNNNNNNDDDDDDNDNDDSNKEVNRTVR